MARILSKKTTCSLLKRFTLCVSVKYFLPAVLILLLITITTGFSQSVRNTHRHATYVIKKSFKKLSYKTLGITLNSLNYFGDLAPAPKRISTDLGQTRPGYGLLFEHRKGPQFSYRASFMYGTITGSDARLANEVEADLANDRFTESYYRYRRNVLFKNHIKELSVTFVFDFIENNNVYFHRPVIAPYVFTGITLFHHNPKGKIPARDVQGNPLQGAGTWVELQPLGTEGQHAKLLQSDANFGLEKYRLLQPSIPIGIGARYKYNNEINIFCEFSFRYLFTDYVDDVSRNYVDLGVFDDEISKAMSYRGNDFANIRPQSYTGRDGKSYVVEAGFGSEHQSNIRGNKNDKDMLFIFTIGGAFVLRATHTRAKFR
jgi:hypothetical protein